MVKGLSERAKAQYRDAVRYYSSPNDTVGTSRYRHVSVLDDPVGKEHLLIPVLGQLNGTFSGPLPGLRNATFFLSGLFRNEDSYLPWGFDLDRQLFAKFSYRFSPGLKVSFDAQNTWSYRQQYNHYYKYIPPPTTIPATRSTSMRACAENAGWSSAVLTARPLPFRTLSAVPHFTR